MRKLKILFAGNLPPQRGGSATANAIALRALAARGHSIRAASPVIASGVAEAERFAAANPRIAAWRFEVPRYVSANTFPLPPEVLELNDFYYAFAARESAREPPDLVLAGDVVAGGALDCARERGIPSVTVAHGGALYRLFREEHDEVCRKWLDWYRTSDLLIAVAAHQSRLFDALNLEHYRVIPNVTDTADFAPRPRDESLRAELRIPPHHVVVAHFSNLQPIKRLFDLAGAARLALQRNPDLTFLIGGEGLMRAGLESHAAELGIADHFRFPGWIPAPEMPAYYSIADMVVMCSESEARAMVYLETLASGRTLIASDIPAAREAIEPEATGLLYPTGSVEVLAATILRAAADPALREAFGNRGRAVALQNSLEAYGETWERTLGELVARGRRKG